MRTIVVAALVLSVGATLEPQARADGASQSYSGDFLSRSTLTGDWGGARNDLAAHGVTFDASFTQSAQGVMEGGKDHTWEYGARGILNGLLDTQKAGLWPGGFLSIEVEGNFGSSVNGKTGAFMPVDSNQIFPLPTGDNLNIPQLAFVQFVSPYVGFNVGKVDTSSGDANAFAHGKGDEQFMNLGLNFNGALLADVPYSALGIGMIVLPTKDPNQAIMTFSVVQANGDPSVAGFSDLDINKLAFAGEGRFRTHFFGHTGHQLVGGIYNNQEYTSLDQRISFPLRHQHIAKKDGAWAGYYNFDQYFYQPEKGVDRGIGLFGRFAGTDGNPNPIHYFYSAGVGGTGMISGRPYDRFGLGYYYIDVRSPTLQGPLREHAFFRDEWGFEAFYNIALTPWLLLTPDVQVVGPSQKQKTLSLTEREPVDTAVVLGFRLQVVL